MLWIVSGPTSVGKSTFIGSSRCSEITSLPQDTPVVWPANHSLLDELPSYDLFYHYNTLRSLYLKRQAKRLGKPEDEQFIRGATDFERDPQWADLNNRATQKKAIVLVAAKQTILRRAKLRNQIEVFASANLKHNRYNARNWTRLLEQVNLAALYKAWCRELRTRGIPYVLVNSEENSYPVIEHEDCLPDILNSNGLAHPTAHTDYSEESIREILRTRRFAYQRVELPYGLHTPGADRSATRDLVLPETLEGKTVLDVGSALGYFSFEAEARGAKKVVGVELKEDRFYDALLLKSIKGSQVEFLRRDVIANPLNEMFDHVLLLNVIHHLTEPFRVMRQLAQITRECLVIEFPTFEDLKFNNTVEIEDPSICNRLPLVGVSTISGADQTFVFTPPAIERALTDHERLFERVEILKSPMPGRAIAICHK